MNCVFFRFQAVCAGLLTVCFTGSCASPGYQHSELVPPPPQREFRAAWVATVLNIDWPSRKGLSTSEQKSELVSMLDRAAKLNLNAVIFQVRPECDAFYDSRFEPWSEYLTGEAGKGPLPFYDPLEFAVAEAHKRGLELHAWFNPFRARHAKASSPVARNHVSKIKPQLVRDYGNSLWLDPGEPDAQAHSLRIIMDVVNRYEVDGIHFDDYFYPYPEKDASGVEMDFPDEASWVRFGRASGLSRGDWRRRNVDQFVQRVYTSVKATKPWIKFGISPFGIWRPGNPPSVRGFDAYDKLYADARQWLQQGWVDYLTPQLYWPIDAREQSFTALLQWWDEQNVKGRYLWPGLAVTSAEKWPLNEIPRQMQFTRQRRNTPGQVFWNLKALLGNPQLLVACAKLYPQPALVPQTISPGDAVIPSPKLDVVAGQSSLKVSWSGATTSQAKLWIVQMKRGDTWTTQVLPGTQRVFYWDKNKPDAIAVTGVGRTGALGKPSVGEIGIK